MRCACQHKRGIMASRSGVFLYMCLAVLALIPCYQQAKQKNSLIVSITDFKDFKKLLRTKTNLLVIFAQSEKAASKSMPLFQEVAEEMKGKATLAYLNCGDDKKLCKKLKASPTEVDLKHYKDGEFNKDYDRKFVLKSMVNFLLDPTGDLPWDEDPTALDVRHVDSDSELNKMLKKEKLPILLMFYAPWCGFCKRLKPEYAAAATEMKGQAILAGFDVDKPQHMMLRAEYNITGFPTLYYFEKGKLKYKYGGENNKDGIISWLKNPQAPQEPKKEAEWADEPSDVVHLTDDSFSEVMAANPSVLVMFYAPWCGHCKKMKPEYTSAAKILKDENVPGVIAALDATKHNKMAEEYKIKGFPTVKYFKDGQFAFDFNERTEDKIIEFMKDPKEPPPPPPPEPRWEEIESDVIHLTEETFKPVLKKKKHALVMFYAPWCGHCKKAKPEFMQAAAQFKDDTKVAFGALDCTTQAGVCSAHDVTGYPTFKYFNYGKDSQKYMGGREESDFVNFMKDPLNTNPTPTPPPPAPSAEEQWTEVEGYKNIHFLTQDNFDDFVASNPSVLVMFYAPWCGHCKKMKPAYGEAAAKLKDEKVAGVLAAVDATAEPTLAQKFEVKGYPTLKYFKNGKSEYEYKGGRKAENFVEFMKNPKAPPPPPPPEPEWSSEESDIAHLDESNFDSVITSRKSVLVMFYAPWCGHCKKMKPDYKAAATTVRKEIPDGLLAAVDATKHSSLAKKYKVKGYPTLKYFEDGKPASEYTGGRKEADLVAFMRSPPRQKDWKDVPSAVKHLSTKNFSSELTKLDAALVMFYSPDCGHCRKSKPKFQEAAEAVKTDSSKALAAVDCSQERDLCRKQGVHEYPTFKLYVKGDYLSDFEGDRQTNDFVKFIQNAPQAKKDEL